ncbi:transposase [Candidatus Kaiserbacteria bacterium]|nr:transposase [Candidatus Kaiserbacteria bacterium]
MYREPYGAGSFVHVIQRGTRGSPIVRDEADRERFLFMLAHFNDEFAPENWFRDISANDQPRFERPIFWPEQKKIVHILGFCLLTNHFHLLLEEVTEGGISKFLHRIGTAVSKHFNKKYGESGSLFQGPYRSRTIASDTHLTYASAYVQVKNAFDMYRYGLDGAMKAFDQAYTWALNYPYSSLGDYGGVYTRPIVDKMLLSERFTPKEYKTFCRDFFGKPDVEAGASVFE